MDKRNTTRLGLVFVIVVLAFTGLRASAVQIEGAEGSVLSKTFSTRHGNLVIAK